MVEAFEGNKAETATMIPTITAFKDAHRARRRHGRGRRREWCPRPTGYAIEAAGLSFILGAKIAQIPYVVDGMAHEHPGTSRSRTGTCSPSPGPPARPTRGATRSSTTSSADRARRTLRGIDEQIAKAEKAVAGKAPVKRNRFITITGGDQAGQPDVGGQSPRAWPGSRATPPTSTNPTPEFVIGAYHQLWHIEKAFRMSKHDLRARPIYHHTRESIEAHLTIVFAALAVTRLIEDRTSTQGVRQTHHYRVCEGRVAAGAREAQSQPRRRKKTTNSTPMSAISPSTAG